ncbi:restriction endonuclease subunit S [uncultured Thiodictyon sp.]|jgi:type I restriction enzyme S subunit|uniref:restriction endonuclease subunit S n=1 Tax=uncultured Thiodictyon sp. TaxID=1846217 RepID=UPI0025D93CA3|nr:restriction endonuclease subunit S [uncultured Thiodictyon sp.]
MNQEQLLKHFDRIVDAPDAVPRLRRFILDLAVRGKLEEQDPDDEPAAELLKRIQATKAGRNLKDRAKPGKGKYIADTDQTAYQLPSGWTWVSLADLTAVLNGRAYSKNELLDEGTPVLRVGNLFTSDHWYYSNLTLDDDKYCDEGDLLFSWSASFGPFIWPGPKVIYHYHIWKLSLHDELNLDKNYFYRFLLHKTQEIKDSGHGVSMLHMTKEKMELVQVPLPPLAEQHRIVAKVDELMALCDRLEAAQNKREQRRDRLVAASLSRINQPAPSAEGETTLREHARFHLIHFPRLTTRPEHIKTLRQTILNLAVRGRLVPQDQNDEPASTTLVKNDTNRKAIASHDRRADADAQELLAQDARWNVPASWCWRGVADLALFIDYRGKTPTKLKSGVRLITAKNVKPGVINHYPEEFISEDVYSSWMTRGIPKDGDVLFTTEAPMGNAAVVHIPGRFALAQRVINFSLYGAIDADFLVLQLLSEPFQAILSKTATGMTAKGIKAAKLKRLPLTIPPLAEQHRIVAKVDELMAVCDQLEANLTTTQTDSRRLLEAVLRDALAPALEAAA